MKSTMKIKPKFTLESKGLKRRDVPSLAKPVTTIGRVATGEVRPSTAGYETTFRFIHANYQHKRKFLKTQFEDMQPPTINSWNKPFESVRNQLAFGADQVLVTNFGHLKQKDAELAIVSFVQELSRESFSQRPTVWVLSEIPIKLPKELGVFTTYRASADTDVPEAWTPNTQWEMYANPMTIEEYKAQFADLCRGQVEDARAYFFRYHPELLNKINLVKDVGTVGSALKSRLFTSDELIALDAWDLIEGPFAWKVVFWGQRAMEAREFFS